MESPEPGSAPDVERLPGSAEEDVFIFPASFAQQRLWFLNQLEPEDPAYNVSAAIRLDGALDEAALARSLNEIVRRHEALRTTFAQLDGAPVQVIVPALMLSVPVVDLQALPAAAQEREALRQAIDEARRLFDLSRGPLIRATLLRLGREAHILLVSMHHIVSDGWSVGVFVRELTSLYQAFVVGAPSPLPELSIQYADFAHWQRQLLSGAEFERQLSYWKGQLAGAPPVLELPTDRPRTATDTGRGGTHNFELSAELTRELKRLSQRSQGTLFMTLLSAFAVLLSRYSREEDVVIGSPIANRNRSEIEPLIGFFVNALALRINLSGDPTFSELLGRVRQVTLDAYSHQDLPFERLVDELHLERNLGRSPLFQVLFALQNAPAPPLELAGLSVRRLELDFQTVRFDLEVHLWEVGEGLRGSLVYNADLFDPAAIARLATHLQTLLAGVAANPESPVSQLPLMAAEERRRLLVEWNETSREYPQACLHEVFAARAEERPEAVAVVFEEQQLTYRELNARANQLARHLRSLGVGVEVPVGLCLERSLEMIVGVLGILKAGGVCVPLSATYPRERLAFMMRDTRAPAILTDERQVGQLPNVEARVICLDRDWAVMARESESNVASATTAGSLAYLIYTSGSTGTPKGVEVYHRGILRLLFGVDYVDLGPEQTTLQFAPISFDTSFLEIWGALLHGGRCVLFPNQALTAAGLGEVVKKHGVSLMWLTGSLFNVIIDEDPGALASVGQVVVGGEALSVPHIERALASLPGTQLVNGYGPTECTTFGACYRIPRGLEKGRSSIPIGRPIANTEAYVLDRWLQPVPVGVPGELYLGGAGLARGYFNRPELTEERFVPHPFSDQPGARLYRTGDLTRFLPDGNLEFLGRIDRQLKIRGFRIEPGEIEAQLLRHPGVREAAVIIREDRAGDKRLAACIVPEPEYSAAAEGQQGLAAEQVSGWAGIFDEYIHGGQAEVADPLFNTTGWVSSYDGRPIPPDEMRVWAGDISRQVLALRPRRVLEIGCGTGIILFQVAPHCEAYHGVDISQLSLDYVQRQIQRHEAAFSHVTLARRSADELDDVESGSFDAVILSSVAQYFPSVEYLLRVVERAIRAVRPGGAILFADVRSLPLLRAFHLGVQLRQADGELSTGELRARVEEEVRKETELCIDPAFFPALRERFPEISAVQLRLQRGREHNELNKFRYTAILHLGREADPSGEGRLLDGGGKGLEEIRRHLADERPERLCLQNMTDARLAHDLRGVELLSAEGGFERVSDLRRALADAGAEGGDAEEVWRVAQESGYRAEAFWSDGSGGKFDAVFVREDVADGGLHLTPFVRKPSRARPWSSYANRPLRAKLRTALISEIRQHLAEGLPDYMVPASFVLLDELPLSPSGKADHRALLKLAERARPESEAEDVGPRTSLEEALSAIWVQVLGLERVSVNDNFFNLGGHSLLAIQLIAQVRQAFEVNLPLRRLFESPTVAGLAEQIEAARRETRPGDETSGASLSRIAPDWPHRYEPFPLTDVQSAYWIGRREVFELGNVAAHAYVEVDGVGLDLERLNLAWQKLIERHEMLRAIILPDGRQQILERVPPYRIEVLDLRGQEPQSLEARLAAVRQEMSHQVLPTEEWPLFEIRATRLDEQRTRLHIGLDALTGDAHSFNLLFSEWYQLYRTPGLTLAPLDLSFRDYVLAEEALRDSDLARRDEEYWFSRLDALPPAPELPLARNPTTLTHPRFTSYNATLDAASWERLKERARQRELTPSGALLAAFAEVLTTWSKSPRLTINLTLFNRLPLHPQVNEIVGDFTSLTLLEVDNSAPEPFAARAKRIQQQLWQDLDHRSLGGVRVMRELARRQRRSPQASMPIVFTSVLGLGAYDDAGFGLSSFGELAYATNQTPQIWLDHGVLEQEGALVCVWNVVEELFPDGMLEEMFEAYVSLLRALAATESAWQQPHRSLLPADQHQRRLEVNDTAAPLSDELLHTLFIRQAQARPQAPAVITAAGCLSYGQLRDRAAAVAVRLRQLQARPEELVAVVMEKGPEQVVAVLGVLMASAAYLPLEPTWPRQRLWSLLERTQARVVLTQGRLRERLAWPEGVTVLAVDELEQEPTEPLPQPLASPDHLAYVIFTSGSTGEPKGVMIEHRGAVNTVLDINRRFGVGAGDRVLALSSLSFDLSVYDLFGLLAAGGAVVLPEAGREKDPEHWLELIATQQVTVWNTVPALMQMLVEYAEGQRRPAAGALRLALLSGDWVPVSLPGRVRGLWPEARPISLGGATEASIWSIYHEVQEVPSTWKSIPYGRPLSNQQFAVLNPLLGECPEWVVGELYIGGVGLARGYWGDERKSSASFIRHPDSGQRLYKTGDLGRYLANGEIEFLGREDFQVKINGYRIELGEVEAALQGHPLVREAVVNAAVQESGQAQLVAYVVVEPTTAGGGPAQSGAAFAPASAQGAALDPLGQLEFKLRRAGLRQLPPDAGSVRLTNEELESEAVVARYLARQSYREFDGGQLRLAQLGGLLGSLRALEREQYAIPKYRYPSAGSLYPVQTYLYLKPDRVAGLDGGWYYYHPVRHELVRVGGEPRLGAEAYGEINRAIYEASAFALFLVGEMGAIAPIYGEKARDFSLLEAGYMGQLLMSESGSFELGLCPIGEVEGQVVRAGLDLGAGQEVLHSLVGGPISRAQSQRWRGGESLGLGATGGRQLRDYLAERLPGYMVPSSVVVVERMPLSSNGKVDRQALARLGTARSRGEGAAVVAATAWEQRVAALVAGVLGVSEVGVGENLFDLGASSIHLVRLQRKLHEELGREVPIVELFGRPTVRALADYLGRDTAGEAELGEMSEAARRRKAERQKRLERRGIRDFNPNPDNGGEPA